MGGECIHSSLEWSRPKKIARGAHVHSQFQYEQKFCEFASHTATIETVFYIRTARERKTHSRTHALVTSVRLCAWVVCVHQHTPAIDRGKRENQPRSCWRLPEQKLIRIAMDYYYIILCKWLNCAHAFTYLCAHMLCVYIYVCLYMCVRKYMCEWANEFDLCTRHQSSFVSGMHEWMNPIKFHQ